MGAPKENGQKDDPAYTEGNFKKTSDLARVLRKKRDDDERGDQKKERIEPSDSTDIRLIAGVDGRRAGEQIQ